MCSPKAVILTTIECDDNSRHTLTTMMKTQWGGREGTVTYCCTLEVTSVPWREETRGVFLIGKNKEVEGPGTTSSSIAQRL